MTQYVSLSDAITLQRGFDLPTSQRKAGNYPVVTSTGMSTTHNEFKVKGPGVVIGRSGSIGGGQYIENDFWPLNTTLWVKDFKGNNEKYIYYLLKSLDFSSFNAGAAVPTLNRNHLSALKVRVPDLAEQEEVADILGSIDEKIELNRKMNETLEQMGRALFHHYFMDNPESETWGEMSIEEISQSVFRGFTAKYVDQSDIINLNQKVNKGAFLDKQYFKYYSPDTIVPEEKYAKKGDILINSLGQGTLGRVHHYIESTDNVVIDQHITIVRSNMHNYLYFRLAYSDNQRLQSLVSGTTGMLMLNVSKIRSFKVKIPPEDSGSVITFNVFIDSVNELIVKNNSELRTLVALRDTLLPRLISGTVELT